MNESVINSTTPSEPQPDFSTAANAAQQEQHDDNDGASADRGQQGVRSQGDGTAANGRAAQDAETGRICGADDSRRIAGRGQGNGRLPLLIDNDTLRKQIAADPDDEPSAGSLPPPADALVERLRALYGEHTDECRNVDNDAPWACRACEAMDDAADRIAALTAERDDCLRVNAIFKKREGESIEREFVLEQRADLADAALATAEGREKALREALEAARNMRNFVPVGDREQPEGSSCPPIVQAVREFERLAALARKEGE